MSQSRFASISYPKLIVGGTGKFSGADGHLESFGEADLQFGTALRYSGQVCFADGGADSGTRNPSSFRPAPVSKAVRAQSTAS